MTTTHPHSRSPGDALTPHTRGLLWDSDDVTSLPLEDRLLGSSPHARGLLAEHVEDVAGSRIIPARAGFTPGDPGRREGAQDHPRTRGVYRAVNRATSCSHGSSPHARGLRCA